MGQIKIQYADLPVHIRLLFLLIGIIGFSALLHAFILGFELAIESKGGLNMGVAIAVTIGSMRRLKIKSSKGYWGSIAFLLLLPCYSIFQAFQFSDLAVEAPALIYYWPLINSVLILFCLAVLLNKTTYDFYK